MKFATYILWKLRDTYCQHIFSKNTLYNINHHLKHINVKVDFTEYEQFFNKNWAHRIEHKNLILNLYQYTYIYLYIYITYIYLYIYITYIYLYIYYLYIFIYILSVLYLLLYYIYPIYILFILHVLLYYKYLASLHTLTNIITTVDSYCHEMKFSNVFYYNTFTKSFLQSIWIFLDSMHERTQMRKFVDSSSGDGWIFCF